MDTKKLVKINPKTVIFVVAITAYTIWSIVNIAHRIPYFDEINAWNIAANCNFTELLEVCKHEGHTILWYLLLKPFAANNIMFPYPMYIINWIFAFGAILLLWLKAPFNQCVKLFITFSIPMQIFSIYARCYSIGIFLIFLICTIYNSRLKHPIIYSLILVLLANTSVMGSIAAFSIGIIYIFDLIIATTNHTINKYEIIKPLSIFMLGITIVLIQLSNFSIPIYSVQKEFLIPTLKKTFYYPNHIPHNIAIITHVFLLLSGFGFFIKDKKPYIFIITATCIIFYISLNIYVLSIWHYIFIFVFLISGIWIYLTNNKSVTVFQEIYFGIFCALCFNMVVYYKYPWQWNGYHLPITTYTKNNIEYYENSNIFLFPTDSSIIGIIPMLSQYNINFYDSHGNSYKSAQSYIEQWKDTQIYFSEIEKIVKKSHNNNYLFIPTMEEYRNNHTVFLNQQKLAKPNLDFINQKIISNVIIYKIQLKNRNQ